MIVRMEGQGFGGLFGDPEELRRRMEELAEQMQGAQKVAWADNAIKLAVDMTVASISSLELSGSTDEQAVQVRDAIRVDLPRGRHAGPRGPRGPRLSGPQARWRLAREPSTARRPLWSPAPRRESAPRSRASSPRAATR